jgi:hypothetical protein
MLFVDGVGAVLDKGKYGMCDVERLERVSDLYMSSSSA